MHVWVCVNGIKIEMRKRGANKNKKMKSLKLVFWINIYVILHRGIFVLRDVISLDVL